jgi:hypothetical protein
VLKNAEHLATTAAAHAILIDKPEAAVEVLDQGRAIFWSQGLKLRSEFSELPIDLRNKLSTTAYQLEKAMYQAPQDNLSTNRAELEELDQKIRRLSGEFQELLREIRELPGHERFLLPLDFATLASAAQRGPIIVFLTSEIVYCAIIIRYGSPVQVIKLGAIPSHIYEAADASFRSAFLRNQQENDHLDHENYIAHDGTTRLGLAKGHRSGNSIELLLDHVWETVMQPVIQALNIEVQCTTLHPSNS